MIHYLWTGHFEIEDGHVRFERAEDALRPEVSQTFDLAVITKVFQEIVGAERDLTSIPKEWGVYLSDDGILFSNQYTHHRDAVVFVARVAERTGGQTWADHGSRILSPRAVLKEWDDRQERLLRARQAGLNQKADP